MDIYLDICLWQILQIQTYLCMVVGPGFVVVVCLPRPMEGMGRLKFSDLFTELSVPPQAAGVVGPFYCAFIYHSEHYGLIFRGYLFIFVYISIFLQVHVACVVMYLTSFDGFF